MGSWHPSKNALKCNKKSEVRYSFQKKPQRNNMLLNNSCCCLTGRVRPLVTLLEAKVLIERWRREYNTIRPHSSLGYRPPAPEATQPWSAASATLQLQTTAEGQKQETLT